MASVKISVDPLKTTVESNPSVNGETDEEAVTKKSFLAKVKLEKDCRCCSELCHSCCVESFCSAHCVLP